MILGDFQFDIKSLSPNSITRTTEYNWSDIERVGNLPNLQNLGIAKDQIEIEGVFYPGFAKQPDWNSVIASESLSGAVNSVAATIMPSVGNYTSISDIRKSNLIKAASNLINDSGEILGKFVIASIKETQSYFDKDGNAQKIEFTMILKRSPAKAESNALVQNDSIVNTITKLARNYLRW